jgi:hypothetical protein
VRSFFFFFLFSLQLCCPHVRGCMWGVKCVVVDEMLEIRECHGG